MTTEEQLIEKLSAAERNVIELRPDDQPITDKPSPESSPEYRAALQQLADANADLTAFRLQH